MSRGTEHRRAVAAIDHALAVQYQRPETVHQAIGRTLALIGARRLHAAVGFDQQAADDRRLLRLLSRLEDLAVRLSGIPVRVENRDERTECWTHILAGLREVKSAITRPAVVAAPVEAPAAHVADAG